MSLYFSPTQELTIPTILNLGLAWSNWFIFEERPRVNYQSAVSTEYTGKSVYEQLRVAGVLALVETFNFPLSRIAINVSLPTNKRKKAAVVVYRDDAHREPQLVLECQRASLTARQREEALKKTVRKAQALGAAWALCAIGDKRVLVAKAVDAPTVVELPFTLVKGLDGIK